MVSEVSVDSGMNLTSIFISDSIGILILIMILVTRGWNLPARKHESRMIFWIILASVINCTMDAVVSVYDGHPGSFYYPIEFIGNTVLYIYNLFVGMAIIHLVVTHLDKNITKWHFMFFGILTMVELAFLVDNFFSPLVFYIDENNSYHRGEYYWVFIIGAFAMILYAYIYYFLLKLNNKALRYFPVWEFLLPIVLGLVIQTQFYDISLQPVSFAIAFNGLVICLQNECIYIDKLTGVYNRYEFDKIRKDILSKKSENIAAIMFDLNDFKSINDNYSHEEGDNVLVTFANILVEEVKSQGFVIRFAGDEFIIIIRKFTGDSTDEYISRIRKRIDEYNETSGKPYKISAAMGGDVFRFDGHKAPDLMSEIDNLMYKDKDEFYKGHVRSRD